ncbi:MAG: hypothetical protein ABIT01_20350 [Thermoanaerobaculia bacterium]
MTDRPSTPSPEATGEAGAAFEFQVDAVYLALLLAGGFPPLLPGCRLETIDLQSGHLGWRTDDLLLVGVDRAGLHRRAAIQAKKRFSFHPSDAKSVEALARAWGDFNDKERFDPDCDVVGFVLQTGSSDFFHGFRALLDCARAAVDAPDLERRLKLARYLPKTALKYHEACRAMLESSTGETVPQDGLFHFLRALDFVQMDLGPSGSSTEASIRTVLQVAAAATAGAPQTDTWAELVATALNWDSRAQSVTARDVTKQVGWAVPPAGAPFERELEALRNTTDISLRRIEGSIGDVEVRRTVLETELLGLLNRGDVVIVAGDPGAGKSALAARAFQSFRSNGLALAFRPGMLAGSHINQVLLSYGQTAGRLLSICKLFSRNIVLVESAERFLETADAEREAFRDLLATLGEDPGWGILITCRSFAVDTFRSAFLEGCERAVSVLPVPEFNDEELAAVAARIPALSAPLAHSKLRSLIRNPFYLGMAAKLSWASPLPSDARGFRKKVWSEVVRAEAYAGGGMPMRRANTFVEITLRRARSLQPYVQVHDLDAQAIQELRHDMLVAQSPELADAFAPAHDMLEDWALLQWLEIEFMAAERVPDAFFVRLGTHPAIRRAFRVWLSEWLDVAFDEAAAWALGVVRTASVSSHWVDDTLTAALLSEGGGRLVEMIAKQEAYSTGGLLPRLLHLTRVACRRLPDAAREPHLVGMRFLLPEGKAWEALAGWLEATTEEIRPTDAPQWLRFLEDWALQVSDTVRNPSGAHAAASVALRLADRAAAFNYSDRKGIEARALKVALRVPKVVESELMTRVDAALASDHHDPTIVGLVLELLSGATVARDLPGLTIKCVEHAFGIGRDASKRRSRSGWEDDGPDVVDRAFGVPPFGRELGFPPSALHGPFHSLFLHHPDTALDLILRLTNHACDAYGRTGGRTLEQPGRIPFTLPDGLVVTQWTSGRLWGLYRSATVGPYPLQCALMALESRLLAWADAKDPGLEGVLLHLLASTNNVAITAVIMSVVQAWPEGTWRVLLPLLAHEAIFDMDRQRWIADQSGGAGRLLESPMRNSTEDQLYATERKKANAREHRQQNLEGTALQLQLTEARDAIWSLIDECRKTLPAVAERTDRDRLWALVLHRIDLRKYVPAGEAKDGRIPIQPSPPSDDVVKMLAERRPEIDRHTTQLTVLMWATATFKGDRETAHDPSLWSERLSEAKRFLAERRASPEDPFDPTASAPAYVAAVCVRDHWEELNEQDRAWCQDAICRSVEATVDDEFSLGGESLNLLDGAMAAAMVLPGLVPKAKDEAARLKLLNALSAGVLHAKSGFVEATMVGIGRDLWTADRELALTCLKALVAYFQAMETNGRRWAYQDQAGKRELRTSLREIIRRGERWEDSATVLATLNYSRWPLWGLVKSLLTVFSNQPTDVSGLAYLSRLVELLAASWVAELGRRGRDDDDEEVERFEGGLPYEISHSLATIVLQLSPAEAQKLTAPIRAAIPTAVREAAEFLEALIVAQDGRDPRDTFLALWRAFADAYAAVEASSGFGRDDLLRPLFFDISWKPGVREWAPLKGHEQEVGALFRRLSPSEELVEVFSEFLRTIGRILVPDLLPDVAAKLAAGGKDIRLTGHAIDRLEVVLSSLVYGGAARIRAEKQLREGTLVLLDAMIEGGSSAAYRMRDDFLTPLAVRP